METLVFPGLCWPSFLVPLSKWHHLSCKPETWDSVLFSCWPCPIHYQVLPINTCLSAIVSISYLLLWTFLGLLSALPLQATSRLITSKAELILKSLRSMHLGCLWFLVKTPLCSPAALLPRGWLLPSFLLPCSPRPSFCHVLLLLSFMCPWTFG